MTAPARRTLRGATVCSGIGGAEVAAPWIDWRWKSEVARFPSVLLDHRFPTVPNRGDMTRWREWPDERIDILCGGTPCQSFSLAGKRGGMEDPRGNLAYEFAAMAGEMRPAWVVWENVPGVLSSDDGRALASFVGALVERGYCVAWRVLDAAHVRTSRFPAAVPQRRKRVFLVGHSGRDPGRPASILFDAEGLQGDTGYSLAPDRPPAPGNLPLFAGAGGGEDAEDEPGRVVSYTVLTTAGGRSGAAGSAPHMDNLVVDGVLAKNLRELPPPDRRMRRLLPVETERLMGFPDGWTQVPSERRADGTYPDAPRYMGCGNSWAVNVADFVLTRIGIDEGILPEDYAGEALP